VKVCCSELCDYKKEIGSGRLRCEHPAVLEIEKSLEEKSIGLILATALNKIGKALQVKIASDAYEKDKWMNFPFSYYKGAVASCGEFKRVKLSTKSERNPAPNNPIIQLRTRGKKPEGD
jgi:hypothetical protein